MRLFSIASAAVAAMLAAWIVHSSMSDAPVEFTPQELRRILAHSPLGPLPVDPTNAVADDPAAIALGERLFFDRRFSPNGEVSCATCHDPARGWSNGAPRGRGLGTTARHVPTLWNVGYNRWYNWDGGADTLWMQAIGPWEHPDEVGGDRVRFAHIVYRDPSLRRSYEQLFGAMPALDDAHVFPPHARPWPAQPQAQMNRAWERMSAQHRKAVNQVLTNLTKALAAYERRITNNHAPFDAFVDGLRENDARKRGTLPAAAQRGLKLFVGKANCSTCHSGPNFSDGEFHDLRLPEHSAAPLDAGRYAGVQALLKSEFAGHQAFSDDARHARTRFLAARADSWGQFKTPTLRGVAQTAPYMHNGAFATLPEVVRFYSTLERAAPRGHHDEGVLKPLNLTPREQADLVAFLQALSGRAERPMPATLEP